MWLYKYVLLGKIEYQFALLNEARKKVPEPPEPQNYNIAENASQLEMPVAANFR